MVVRAAEFNDNVAALRDWYLEALMLDPQQPPPQTQAQQVRTPWNAPDRMELGESLSPDLREWLSNRMGDDPQFGDLLQLLIDYFANEMEERNRNSAPPPRSAGSFGGGGQHWSGSPQRTSWNGNGSNGNGNAPSNATPATTATPTTTATPSLPPGQNLDGLKIQVVGDSLMVGAKDATTRALSNAGAAGVNIDAEVGRAITSSGEGKHMSPQEIRQSAEQSGANVVVVELGTNHADYARFVPETMNELSKIQPPPLVVWVNTQTQRPATTAYGQSYYDENAQINKVIAAEAAKRPNMAVADWSQIAGGPGINGGDGLHLTGAGSTAMAKLIMETIANARASR